MRAGRERFVAMAPAEADGHSIPCSRPPVVPGYFFLLVQPEGGALRIQGIHDPVAVRHFHRAVDDLPAVRLDGLDAAACTSGTRK